MICNDCKQFAPIENHELGLCPTCNKKRRELDDELYPAARRMFLAMCIRVEATCPIMFTPIDYDSDIHHTKGRSPDAYADEWALERGIPLLIDVRHFLAVSRQGHEWIERHPEAARRRGFTVTRLNTLKR